MFASHRLLRILVLRLLVLPWCLAAWCVPGHAIAQDASRLEQFGKEYDATIRPLLQQYCLDCHAGEEAEAEIDLARLDTFEQVRQHTSWWQKVRAILESEQMPPPESAQPTDEERQVLQRWVRAYLITEAEAQAGDPGPVILRRLSNSEYTYTLRDLTSVDTLEPAREFPVDGAAGEGFTNVGSGLVMSPSLVTKYLDAGKEVARHLVLLPDGIRFSASTSRRDWTNEALQRIRQFYDRYTGQGGGLQVDLQGIRFETNQGGRLPLKRYLAALWDHRDVLAQSSDPIARIANDRGLSAKYMALLHQLLFASDGSADSVLLAGVRQAWQDAVEKNPDGTEHLDRMIAQTEAWQHVLWKFNPVGHIGRTGGPASWMEAVDPLVERQEFSVDLDKVSGGEDVIVYFAARSVGKASADSADVQNEVVWERPRIRIAGQDDLLLRDARRIASELAARRKALRDSAAQCLVASASVDPHASDLDVSSVARAYGVDPDILAAWWEYLGIGPSGGQVDLEPLITSQATAIGGHDFVTGWVAENALGVSANSSGEHVRIPGNMRPHSVAVHPSPTRAVAVGWRSPMAGVVQIDGAIQHAHPECGNGIRWTLERRRGGMRQQLASGRSRGGKAMAFGPIQNVAVLPGDAVVVLVRPGDGNHSCDLTAVDLTLSGGERTWDLARDVSPNLLEANPHADRYGNEGVWHFFSEDGTDEVPQTVPAGSLLAHWQLATDPDQRKHLAEQLQRLLQQGPGELSADAPDAILYRQLASAAGPLLARVLQSASDEEHARDADTDSQYGLDPERFGRSGSERALDPASLAADAPHVIAVRLPGDLARGAQLVTSAVLNPATSQLGMVQVQVAAVRAEAEGTPPQGLASLPDAIAALTNDNSMSPGVPVLVGVDPTVRRQLETAFDEFRQLFPPAVCYTRIVPVDEVVTLQLYYREDHLLRKLMLEDSEAALLDRLWDELYYIAQEPLALATVFEQLSEFATQDRPDLVTSFEPLREPINQRAEQFRQRLVETESRHVEGLLKFADRAWRRRLSDDERRELQQLYQSLRADELEHEQAIQLTLARILTSPAFLYKLEEPQAGTEAAPVSGPELAVRLSYFLWSSAPDDELYQLGESGQLLDEETLALQSRRMLQDARTRRLAVEFACQWLHVRDFDQNDEKNEKLYPEFVTLRDDMYEETIRFFEDMFRNDGSVMDLLDADHTFLNERLAAYYGVDGIQGDQWRRVEGMQAHGRGGVLGMAAVLAKQSGASRTSPILRGNWVYETLLGERLPRPPANVPVLPDALPENLTERQLIELHSSAPGCAKCHVRIDAYGFALEQFDAVGRRRPEPADTQATLMDGQSIDGLDGLRGYLMRDRREECLRQFCRKLLGFALGREVQLSDEILLNQMQQRLVEADYRFSVAVETIVTSQQFRYLRGRDTLYNDEVP